jgi:hypothetical protein
LISKELRQPAFRHSFCLLINEQAKKEAEMTFDALERMRREERTQRLVLIAALAVAALLMGLLYVSTQLSGSRSAAVEPAGNDPVRETRAVAPTDEKPIAEPDAASSRESPETAVQESENLASAVRVEGEAEDSGIADADVVAGIVLRKGHNTPVRRLRLVLTGEGGEEAATARTDNDGAFRFAGLPPGKYHLHTVSGNFDYRPLPLVVGKEPVRDIRFAVLPKPPSVNLPRYSAFRPGKEIPEIEVTIFRYGQVSYRVYKLDLAGLFINAASFDDLLRADVSDLDPLESLERGYSYSVAFSEESGRLSLDVSESGLYLLEASAGRETYRGLVSISPLDIVTTQSGSRLDVLVLGLGEGNLSALVKASKEGLLIGEGGTDAAGKFSLELGRHRDCELMVSDGLSLVFSTAELKPAALASR